MLNNAWTCWKERQTERNFPFMQSKCVSTKKVCSAIKFKQWAVSRHMMRSICTKSKCHVDGKKSVMILPGASEPQKHHNTCLKQKTKEIWWLRVTITEKMTQIKNKFSWKLNKKYTLKACLRKFENLLIFQTLKKILLQNGVG